MSIPSPRLNNRSARRPTFIDQATTSLERLMAENMDEVMRRLDNHPNVMTTQTADYTMNDYDAGVFIDGAITVTLPSAVGRANRILEFIKIDSGAASTISAGTETINGSVTQTLSSQYDKLRIISNGTAWFIL